MPRAIDRIEEDYVKAQESLAAIKQELQDAQYSSYIGKEYTTYGGLVFVAEEVNIDSKGVVYLQGIQSSLARIKVEEIDEEWDEEVK